MKKCKTDRVEKLGPGCGYGFNINNDWGKPLVLFAYDTKGAAEAARAQITPGMDNSPSFLQFQFFDHTAFVAKVIRSKLRGEPVSHAFSYRHMGSLATIGRKSAVADFGFVRLRGAMAWWLWGIVHVLFLVGSRNRVAVVLNWIWSYVTYRASTRLITGSSPQGP
jgi:hypothetical protein